jgi:signal transduction histidine kinase
LLREVSSGINESAGETALPLGLAKCGLDVSVFEVLFWKQIELRHRTNCLLKLEGTAKAAGLYVAAIEFELKEILSHLINNAIEAAPTKNKTITVRVNAGAKCARISVINPASRKPVRFLNKMHEPLSRFSFKKNGNGLGLYFSRQTIREWGGEISALFNPHEGTCVTVSLPLVE